MIVDDTLAEALIERGLLTPLYFDEGGKRMWVKGAESERDRAALYLQQLRDALDDLCRPGRKR
jgi:hypothetical protein